MPIDRTCRESGIAREREDKVSSAKKAGDNGSRAQVER